MGVDLNPVAPCGRWFVQGAPLFSLPVSCFLISHSIQSLLPQPLNLGLESCSRSTENRSEIEVILCPFQAWISRYSMAFACRFEPLPRCKWPGAGASQLEFERLVEHRWVSCGHASLASPHPIHRLTGDTWVEHRWAQNNQTAQVRIMSSINCC